MEPQAEPQPALRAARVLFVAGAIAVGVWVAMSIARAPSLLRTADLTLTLTACGALAAAGLGLTTRARTSVLWGALSLVGFALALDLVEAGTAVRYQHLRPAVEPLAPQDWSTLAGLAAFAAVVAIGLTPHARSAGRWLRSHVGAGRVLILLGALAAVSASPLRDLRGFALEIVLATALSLVGLGAVVLACMNLPRDGTAPLTRWIDRVLGDDTRGSAADVVAISAAVFVTVVTALLAVTIWERHPHISDEISFLFQAKYFAAGSLVTPGAPVPELFAAYQIECGLERCLSVLQPGWPALLSLGVRWGVPWLVNPVVAGLNAYLFFLFVRELYGPRLARGSVLLLASSPWFLFLAMSFMNHQATLLGGLLGVLGTTLAIRRGSPAWALLAGAGAGFTSLMRPMDGVIVAVVAWLPLVWSGSWRRRVGVTALFGAGTAALGSLNLWYNYALTGHPLEFPVTSYVNQLWGEGTNNLGFGPDRGVYPLWAHMDGFPGHSPLQAVVNAALNVTALQFDLFGWAIGSLLPVFLLFALWRLRTADWLLVGWVAAINALYSLYWFASGPDFAARYWFLAVVPLVVLAARGISELASVLERSAPGRGRLLLGAAMALLVAQSLLVFVPWRATDKYYRYFNTGPAIRTALERGTLPPGVYLIRGANQPDYAAAMVYAAPDLAGGDRVFAYDSLPDSAERLREAYPESTLRLLVGPSVTGDVYRVYALPDTAR